MPEAEYARYTLALSFITVFTQTVALTLNRIYIVGYKSFGLNYFPSSFLGIQLIIVAAFVLLTCPFMGATNAIYWPVVFLIMSTCFAEFARTSFQQELNFFRFSLIELCRGMGIFSLSLGLIYLAGQELKTWQVISAQAIATSAVFLIFFIRRINVGDFLQVSQGLRLAVALLKGPYKYLIGYYLLIVFFSRIDVLMLKALNDSSETELANYGAAFQYYILLMLGLNAFKDVLLPVMQNVQSVAEMKGIFKKHIQMVFINGLATLAVAWASQWIIPWIDMGKYPRAVTVFQILAVSAIVSFAFSPHVNVVMRFEDFRFLFVLSSAGLLLNVGLNMLLVPKLGAVGAAWATLVAAGGVNGSAFLRSRKWMSSLAALP